LSTCTNKVFIKRRV